MNSKTSVFNKQNIKVFKISQISIFLIITAIYTFEPVKDFVSLFIQGRIKLQALFEYVLFIFASLLISWVYLNFFSTNKIPNKIVSFANRKSTKLIIYLVYFSLAIIFCFLIFSPKNQYFSLSNQIWIGLVFSILGALILEPIKSKYPSILKPIASLLFFALLAFVVNNAFGVNNYPLSLGWSETAHYSYGYSIYSAIVGKQEILFPYMNFGRYILLSLPWFVNSSDIIFHRLWESILEIGMPFLASFFLVNRLKIKGPLKALVSVWGMLFILQGPIYYHLLIIPIFLFWKLDFSTWKKYSLVFILSIWAGVSRINWIPMPAAVGIIMMLLETNFSESSRSQIKYFIKHILSFSILGVTGGAIGYGLVFLISNQPKELLTTAFSSQMLWYRIFPSEAYGVGILLSILTITIPSIIFLLLKKVSSPKSLSIFKLTIISGLLLVFLMGGLVVSAKIGGGTDMHNLDAFILLIFILVLYKFKKISNENKIDRMVSKTFLVIITLVILLPSVFSFSKIKNIKLLDYEKANTTIIKLQEIIDSKNSNNQNILIENEQHLILFEIISGVEYNSYFEKTVLMEALMSENLPYLEEYIYKPLRDNVYTTILLESQPRNFKNQTSQTYADENNVYYEFFTLELLKYYSVDNNIDVLNSELYNVIE